jgi:hypothetical protein
VDVGEMQRKLSRWAEQDKNKQFNGLYDLLCELDRQRENPLPGNWYGSFSNPKPLLCSLMAFSLWACCKCHTTTSQADWRPSLVTVAWDFQYNSPALVSATSRFTT